MSFVLVYITNPTKKEACKIARHLINKKLIACANIFSANSIYPWNGKVAEEKEVILIAKTESKNYNRIVKEVEKIHPYTIPCVANIPVTFNKKYEKWLSSLTK